MRIPGTLIVMAVLALFPARVVGQEVQGRVVVASGGGTVAAAGAQVSITCPGQSARTATADNHGYYRLAGSDLSGWCSVQVRHQDESSNQIRIKVAGSKTTAVLRLEPAQGGWTLKRVAS